ncbi:MAG: YihY/virulence factor BrkB family protein [Acuticoccus sp.]
MLRVRRQRASTETARTRSLPDVEPDRLPYHERLRGRAARSPVDIGWRGWWDVVRRVVRRIGLDNLGLITAGVTFYVFLALIPAVIAIVTVYGLATDNVTLATHVDVLDGYLPSQTLQWIAQEISRIVQVQQQGLSFAFATSVAVSFWSMNNAVIALFGAMNIAYGEFEERSTIQFYLRSFAFTFAALAVGLIMITFIIVLPLALAHVTDQSLAYGGRRIIAPLLFCLVVVAAASIYRVGPCRKGARWQWIIGGAVGVAVGWLAASTLLSWYLSNVANYAFMYGSLGTVIAFMFWLYISVYILLIGAWANAEVERQTLIDTTIGPARPIGERGAYVADSVGEQAGASKG